MTLFKTSMSSISYLIQKIWCKFVWKGQNATGQENLTVHARSIKVQFQHELNGPPNQINDKLYYSLNYYSILKTVVLSHMMLKIDILALIYWSSIFILILLYHLVSFILSIWLMF